MKTLLETEIETRGCCQIICQRNLSISFAKANRSRNLFLYSWLSIKRSELSVDWIRKIS